LRRSSLFERVRAIKTAEEVDILRRAALHRGSHQCRVVACEEGVTEREMLRKFNAHLAENDAAPVVGCIGFGNRGAMINVQPSDRESKQGDLIRWAIPERRYAGITRRSKRACCAHTTSSSGAKVADLFKEIGATVQCKGVPHFEAPWYDLGFAGAAGRGHGPGHQG
jgi:Xaa-Pro dipeptidase